MLCLCLVLGQDSTLRSFSTLHERHNKSLGRASFNKTLTSKNTLKYDDHRMPYVLDFVAGKGDLWVILCDKMILMSLVHEHYKALYTS